MIDELSARTVDGRKRGIMPQRLWELARDLQMPTLITDRFKDMTAQEIYDVLLAELEDDA